MKCPACGSEVADGDQACPSCGLSVGSSRPDRVAGARQHEQTKGDRKSLSSISPRPDDAEARVPDPPPPPSALRSVSENRFLPGTLLADRYRIVSLLGEGGMGEIYRADDLKLSQTMALKFLPRSMEKDPAKLARFLDEVKLARQISHPNVCRVYDVGDVDGVHFISMEYIDGEDLDSLLRRVGRLPKDKAVEIAQQICRGLAVAHQQGILHRDLKPANLMIDSRGIARITDFGLASLASEVDSAEAGFGTPAYMAPEQHAGREVSVKSDIYALGLVLYKLFTGHTAFHAQSVSELARLHLEVSPTPPSELVESFDPVIERVILRCLEKKPGARPSTALAVAAALPGGQTLVDTGIRKTLLVHDVVGRSRWVEELGADAAKFLGKLHHRIARSLLKKYQGTVVDNSESYQLVFDRPIAAVRYGLGYHRALRKLSQGGGMDLVGQVGIHLGEVLLPKDSSSRDTTGSSHMEVEGLAQEIARQLVPLAGGHQTLVTRAAFDLSRQSSMAEYKDVRWLAHGSYEISGLAEPLEIFEVGVKGLAPLRPPEESESVRRQIVQDTISGWRPAPGLELPKRPNWEVERRLSEGGFGEVWLAVHTKTRDRRVFKFCYDPVSLRSLQREITLFRLLKEELGDRDDITRILDWNFQEKPYFIESEYTVGGSLLEWVEQLGGFDEVPMDQRLEIVAQVATALGAAHSVGVLHKDVKPGNVLMTSDKKGRVRAQLSDFGIGQVTEKRRLVEAGITVLGLTQVTTGTRRESSYGGTPLYMAPELLEGKFPTVQADVYALGVMLYQLVVGDFSRALAPGWDRDVDDELLREDIAAAVDGSPEKRIANAMRFAERLRCLDERRQKLEEEQQVREEAERLRHSEALMRRRRKVLSLVSLLLAVFGVAMTIMVYLLNQEADRANREARRANREVFVAQQVSGFLVDLYEIFDPWQSSSRGGKAGETITAREILDRGVRKLETELRDQPEIQARMMDTVGRVYQSLGLYEEAEPLIARALELRRKVFGEDHPEVAESLNHMALLALNFKQDHEGAEALLHQALDMRRRLLGEEDPAVAGSLGDLAWMLYRTGDYERAEPLMQESLQMYQRIYGHHHAKVAESMVSLAIILVAEGDLEAAEPLYRNSLDIYRYLFGEESLDVALATYNLAWSLYVGEKYDDAEPLFQQSLASFRRLGMKIDQLATSLRGLAMLRVAQGEYSEAEPLVREALDIYQDIFPADHWHVAYSESVLGACLSALGRHAEAESLLLRAYPIVRDQRGEKSVHTRIILRYIIRHYESLGRPEDMAMYRQLLTQAGGGP